MHKHPVINAGVLLSGELTVVTEKNETLLLKAGESIVEVADKWHYGKNEGASRRKYSCSTRVRRTCRSASTRYTKGGSCLGRHELRHDMKMAHGERIGLALGGGSARGWAHIGVIQALNRAGIYPDIVCGTSIGALVGAAYVDGDLDRLDAWVRSLTLQTVVGFLDFSLAGGLIKGDRLIDFFRDHFVDKQIAELSLPFAAVATDLHSGREVWLKEGSVMDAVRASIALPGLFTPARHDGKWLVDGGLVNPVPVSLCRAMGADWVIAVDLSSDLVGHHLKPKPAKPSHKKNQQETRTITDSVMLRIQNGMSQLGIGQGDTADKPPAMLDVLASSINIMQVLITRSRLAGEPADVMIAPQLAELGLMEFHRAGTAIETGQRTAEQALPQIKSLLSRSGST